jgi:hypothetical protein
MLQKYGFFRLWCLANVIFCKREKNVIVNFYSKKFFYKNNRYSQIVISSFTAHSSPFIPHYFFSLILDAMNTNIEIYQSPDGQTQLDVQMDNQTVWLTQAQMILLFESSKANISEHLKSIFTDKELDRTEATVRKIRTVQQEGSRKVSRELEYYNLDVIISVGYRVNTKRGIQFRQWATARLKDYLVKGYAINQKRLDELAQMVSIIAQTAQDDDLKLNEAKGLLNQKIFVTKKGITEFKNSVMPFFITI